MMQHKGELLALIYIENDLLVSRCNSLLWKRRRFCEGNWHGPKVKALVIRGLWRSLELFTRL